MAIKLEGEGGWGKASMVWTLEEELQPFTYLESQKSLHISSTASAKDICKDVCLYQYIATFFVQKWHFSAAKDC